MKFLAEQGLTVFIFVFQPTKFDALLLYRSHRINFGVDGWLDKSFDRLKYFIRLTRDVLLRDKMRDKHSLPIQIRAVDRKYFKKHWMEFEIKKCSRLLA